MANIRAPGQRAPGGEILSLRRDDDMEWHHQRRHGCRWCPKLTGHGHGAGSDKPAEDTL